MTLLARMGDQFGGYEEVPLVVAAYRTASGDSGPVLEPRLGLSQAHMLSVARASGESPTLDVVVEQEVTDGTWLPVLAFPTFAEPGYASGSIRHLFKRPVRVRWAIAGGGAEFHFGVVASSTASQDDLPQT